jgi:hypothetical protein
VLEDLWFWVSGTFFFARFFDFVEIEGIIIGVPPKWLTNDYVCFWLLVAFIVVNYIPGDPIFSFYKSLASRPFLWLFEGISWGFSGLGGVEFSRSVRPEAYSMAFLGGVLGGCGGGLVVQAFSLNGTWGFGVPPAFKTPSSRLVGSAVLAAKYLALKFVIPKLPAESIPPLISPYMDEKHHRLIMAVAGVIVIFIQQAYEMSKSKNGGSNSNSSNKSKSE